MKITKGQLIGGACVGGCIAALIAFVVQVLAPVLAKVPGLVICGGGELELVMRRRTSYGLCAGDPDRVHYGVVLIVSTLVWSVLCFPLGVAVVRWLGRRASKR
jgi:hypothetical protein